jgi:hypothetical protein
VLARDLDLLDSLVAARASAAATSTFARAWGELSSQLLSARDIDWRTGKLSAVQEVALNGIMRAHSIDLAKAFQEIIALIEAGRYRMAAAPRVPWTSDESAAEKEWLGRAVYRHGIEPEDVGALCSVLGGLYRDRASVPALPASPGAASRKAKGTNLPAPQKWTAVVLELLGPGVDAADSEVGALKAWLEKHGFKVRVVRENDADAECDLFVTITLHRGDWRKSDTMFRTVYAMNLRKTGATETVSYDADAQSFSRSDVARLKEVKQRAVEWIQSQLPSLQ